MLKHPPLSLYIHIPWCERKCPYCDFNSHQRSAELPESAYVNALLADLAQDCASLPPRTLQSIFIGGGTPSLFSAQAIGRLLRGVEQQLTFAPNIEITLEANPGSAEADKFAALYQQGVNRLSIGIQSFNDPQLQQLGRIHNANNAIAAVQMAQKAGFTRLNLDLMHGLPQQTLAQAQQDLQQALDLGPNHISWYQLTIEPNTWFAHHPPPLPEDGLLWEIQEQGQQQLATAGYQQYEISAYGQGKDQSRHNLNYWQFGDYLAIGAGAHGKLTDPHTQQIRRYHKHRHPQRYLEGQQQGFIAGERLLDSDDRLFEFFLNSMRLTSGIARPLFSQRTGLDDSLLPLRLASAIERELVQLSPSHIIPTQLGHAHLNHWLADLLPQDHPNASTP